MAYMIGTDLGIPSARVITKINAILMATPITTDFRILRMSGSEAKRQIPRYRPNRKKLETCTGKMIARFRVRLDKALRGNCSSRSQ